MSIIGLAPTRNRNLTATDGWGNSDEVIGIEGVVGSSYDDHITGASTADTLEGGAGNDTLRGSAGNDLERGELGDDNLAGGDGNDTLSGGEGNDTLAGKANDDTFMFDANDVDGGDDVITDFTIGEDIIDLVDYEYTSIGDLDIVDGQDGAIITITNGTITLESVLAADLSDSDFDF